MEETPKKAEKGILMGEKDVWEKARAAAAESEAQETEKGKLLGFEEEAIKEELRKEIELMELSPELQGEAEQKAKKIEFLGEKEKLEGLLVFAKEKGIEFAVRVAKNMNDPYVLDIFHDMLLKQGFYKRFMKK